MPISVRRQMLVSTTGVAAGGRWSRRLCGPLLGSSQPRRTSLAQNRHKDEVESAPLTSSFLPMPTARVGPHRQFNQFAFLFPLRLLFILLFFPELGVLFDFVLFFSSLDFYCLFFFLFSLLIYFSTIASYFHSAGKWTSHGASWLLPGTYQR